MIVQYIVRWRGVNGTGAWRKVRGAEGGPWNSAGRADRIARARSRETGSAHSIAARKATK